MIGRYGRSPATIAALFGVTVVVACAPANRGHGSGAPFYAPPTPDSVARATEMAATAQAEPVR